MQPLFRKAALEAQETAFCGAILLIRPLSFLFLSVFSLAIIASVLLFLFYGSYTKRTIVRGEIVPHTGLIKMYAPSVSVVIKKHVHEGQVVKRGDVLYELSGHLHSSTLAQTHLATTLQINSRHESLKNELTQLQQIYKNELAGLQKKITTLEKEKLLLKQQLSTQKNRIELLQQIDKRNQALLTQGYISIAHVQREKNELLEQLDRLATLEHSQVTLNTHLHTEQQNLNSLGLRHQTQLAQLQRNLSTIKQELSEKDTQQQITITAPQAGTVSLVLAEEGMRVDRERPLINIIPSHAQLNAHLYVPTKAIGFIHLNSPVLLRVHAYPYEKFGSLAGTIRSIAQTTASPSELNGISTFSTNSEEPLLYRITVTLPSPTISVNGIPQRLRAGMEVEASILQESRRLYEWVLAPLTALHTSL